MYPRIYSLDFIGLIPNLTNKDVVLSLAIKLAENMVIKLKPKIIIPAIKLSIL